MTTSSVHATSLYNIKSLPWKPSYVTNCTCHGCLKSSKQRASGLVLYLQMQATKKKQCLLKKPIKIKCEHFQPAVKVIH